MFERMRCAVVRHPVRVIMMWVGAAMVLVGLTFLVFGPDGPVPEASAAQAGLLPDRYESARAAKVAERAFPDTADAVPGAILVVSREDGQALDAADVDRATAAVNALNAADIAGVREVVLNPAPSPNGRVLLAEVMFTRSAMAPGTLTAVDDLRERTGSLVRGTGLRAGYTGEAAVAKDTEFLSVLVGGGMLGMVFVLVLVVFRSPWVAILNVLMISVVGQIVSSAFALGTRAFDVSLDSSVTGLLPIVLFGVGTDYVVFLLFRYRERLRLGEDRRTAMIAALGRVGGVIVVSALAVAVSFLALLLSGLGSFRVLGVALALAVLVMVFAGLTLVPAVFSLLGHRAFWPSTRWRAEPRVGLAARTGSLVARRPTAVALAAMAMLAVCAAGVAGYQASYDIAPTPSGTESATALAALESGFPAGTLSPTSVYLTGPGVTEAVAVAYAEKLASVPVVGGIGGVRVAGDVAQVDLLLSVDPLGEKALDAMARVVRPAAAAAAPPGTRAYVGGATSTFTDVRDVVEADMRLILPVAGALIGLVLLGMIRGLLAPVYLLTAVIGGFGATLGASVVVFRTIAGGPGLNFTLPLIVYMFVASIGTDYNIFMIARIREELRSGHGARTAVANALRHAGPPVAAAGVVLAASFAALIVSPSLAQIGFAVTIGILISTFVLAWLLVPALTALAGRAAFWPGRVAPTVYPDGRGRGPAAGRNLPRERITLVRGYETAGK